MSDSPETDTLPAVVVPAGVQVFREPDLPPDDWDRAGAIAAAVDATDSNLLLTFGTAPQRKVSEVFDALLREVRTEDAGVGGDLVIELSRGLDALKIKEMRAELQAGGSTLAVALNRLPLVGPWLAEQLSAFHYFKHRRDRIVAHFDAMEARIADKKEELLKANAQMDVGYEATERNLSDLRIYIAAGERAGERLVAEAEARRQAAAASSDPVVINQYRDFHGNVEAFLTRVVRLHQAYTSSASNLPQIRQIQETLKIALSDVVDTLIQDIPAMKQAVLQLAALKSIADARAGSERRREISREIRELASTTSGEAYLEAKAAQGDFEDELALLETMVRRMAETEQRAREIEADNAARRRDAHARLKRVAEELAAVQLERPAAVG